MATRDVTTTPPRTPNAWAGRRAHADETKLSLKTTEFWAMVVVIAAAVSDTLGDVRAWTLVAAVAIGYMVSRGLAKSGTKYLGEEDPSRRINSDQT